MRNPSKYLHDLASLRALDLINDEIATMVSVASTPIASVPRFAPIDNAWFRGPHIESAE